LHIGVTQPLTGSKPTKLVDRMKLPPPPLHSI